MNLGKIQGEVTEWATKNFSSTPGGRRSWQPLLGVFEEIGELAHAFLKRTQGIRGTPAEHNAAIRDAIGDLVIYLLDFAAMEGIDVEKAIEETWAQVSKRDWQKNKANGELPVEPLTFTIPEQPQFTALDVGTMQEMEAPIDLVQPNRKVPLIEAARRPLR
jgi:NTP pyrophosphatase (non-canonical NTP hydrolase)